MLQGEVAVRVQNFRKSTTGPDFRKGTFELEIGITVKGEFVPLLRMLDWSLLEAKNDGGLYAQVPQRPMLSPRNSDGTYKVLEDDNGRGKYLSLAFFTRTGEGTAAKTTKEAFEFKNLINDAAIAAYRALGQEQAGVGAARAVPAGVSTSIDGAERGFPGLGADDDLPF